MVYNILSAVGRGLFPSYCVLCLNSQAASDHYICSRCADELPWLTSCCEVCSLPLSTTADVRRCGRCHRKQPAFDRCVGAFKYSEPIVQLISDFKYGARLHYGRVLGLQLATRLADYYAQQHLPELLVPVPLHRSRLRQRGFNQSVELMKTVAGELQMPSSYRHLVRHKATASQKDLPLAERSRNVHAAFSLRDGASLPPRVALLDDVVTSGSTVAELARLLKQGGVQQVHVWCVARTDRLW